MSDKIKHKTKHGISFCGDNLQIIKQMPSGYVDMVLTDPPYGIRYKSGYRKSERFGRILNDDNEQRFRLYCEFPRIMKENSICAVFCSWKNYACDYLELSKYFRIINVIIWHKPGVGMGDLKHTLRTDYEMCIICSKGAPQIRANKRMGSVITVPFVNHSSMVHPTEKPANLYRYIIQTWTNPGDIVFDPYAGSFVNAIACIRAKRKYICIEIDEQYYKRGIRRIENELVG